MVSRRQQKDWRHGQPRRWFESDDTPLLADGVTASCRRLRNAGSASGPTLSAGKND